MEERQEFRTEFTDGEVAEIKATIFETAKEVTYPKLGKLYIKFPSVKEDTEISRYYAGLYTKFLREGKLLPMKKLLSVLSESGIWTDEDEAEMKRSYDLYISKSVTIEELKLKKRKSEEDKLNLERLEVERVAAYDAYLDLQLQKNIQLENSIEKQAEQETIIFKLTKCIFKEDGNPRWNSIDELEKENTALEIDKLMTDAVLYWRGISAPL